jgi:hypothetical protein
MMTDTDLLETLVGGEAGKTLAWPNRRATCFSLKRKITGNILAPVFKW